MGVCSWEILPPCRAAETSSEVGPYFASFQQTWIGFLIATLRQWGLRCLKVSSTAHKGCCYMKVRGWKSSPTVCLPATFNPLPYFQSSYSVSSKRCSLTVHLFFLAIYGLMSSGLHVAPTCTTLFLLCWKIIALLVLKSVLNVCLQKERKLSSCSLCTSA